MYLEGEVMNLNQSNQEKLVMLIASGKKTYTEIKSSMPELNDGESDFLPVNFFRLEIPDNF